MRRPEGSVWWIAALAIVALVCLSRGFEIEPVRDGLDPSYTYAMNHAAAQRLAWGHDFVSSHGPYGFYLSTLDMADLPLRKLILALILAGGAGLAATLLVWRETGLPLWLRVVSLVLLVYAFTIQVVEYQVLSLLVLVLLLAMREPSAGGLAAFGLAGLLAGFCLLIKFSLGFGGLLTVAIACLPTGRLWLKASRVVIAGAGAVIGLLGGWLLYRGTPDGLRDFLSTGWDMARSYSSAMSLELPNSDISLLLYLVWLMLLVGWVVSWRARRPLVSLTVFAMPLFVAWKHSVVRQDAHAEILVLFGLFTMLVLLLDAAVLERWSRSLPVVALLTALLATPWYLLPAEELERVRVAGEGACSTGPLEDSLIQPFRLCGLRSLASWRNPDTMRKRLQAEADAELRHEVLPASTRARIGSASVDIYPWEISYVPANRLVWANRPMPASFNAYTASLDRMNAAFFESDRRPAYLLWHALPWYTSAVGRVPLLSIDGRYLLWDEPRTLRSILDRYDPVEMSPTLLLLQTRSDRRFRGEEPLGRQVVDWNTWVETPATTGVLLAHASIKPRAVGRAMRTLFRESAIYVRLRFPSGQELRFRIVPDSAASGFWVSPFAVTFDELPRLLVRGEGHKVVAIRFESARGAGFYEPIDLTWSQLLFANAAGNVAAR